MPAKKDKKITAPMETIPWTHSSTWQQVLLFFEHSCRDMQKLAPCESLAQDIAGKIREADGYFGELCRRTCTCCTDPCCVKATVWFDFRDLLFHFLLENQLTERQIVRRKPDPCPHLTPRGCVLERVHRPFICTWYVCSTQKKVIQKTAFTEGQESILELLGRIQADRIRLEELFLQAVAGNCISSSQSHKAARKWE